MTEEHKRFRAQPGGNEAWRLWGPYLSERAWGTVREDYSADGEAWDSFDHDQARSRAYRWNEDGMAGVCDAQQRLCLALALWNGQDPILKERMFGLSGNQGNHGEDVKEHYFYLDATPSHSFLKWLYKYPQDEFPYALLVDENARRSRIDPPFDLLDSGAFDEDRYWDVEVAHAKKGPGCIMTRIRVTNRGPDRATLHVLPQLWFRNTWSWIEETEARPVLESVVSHGAAWAVQAGHETLGEYHLYGNRQARCMFTENDTNKKLLFGEPNERPYVKDAFHRLVVQGDEEAVNPELRGTKCAAWHEIACDPGETESIDLVLSSGSMPGPFASFDEVLRDRESEADAFFQDLLPGAGDEEALVFRQAFAGMIWSKVFYHFHVARWLDGDLVKPPPGHSNVRNMQWRHLRAADVISMPDSWEYPWFAAWDLAYHAMVFAHIDVGFAKEQIELLLDSRFLHPNGQIPAYEWVFEDVNPPVHAVAALKVFRADRKQHGKGDLRFLRRVFNKLIMYYAWWLNSKDSDGLNVFEGGFMGLDNISVYNRSEPLPPGYSLKQADATGWMAMFALNMTSMALELAQEHGEYEDMAIQCYEQFLAIANSIAGHASEKLSLWDPEAGFFKDLLITPDGACHRIDVYSYVGLIPLLACEVVTPEIIDNVPRFKALLEAHKGGVFDGHTICACPNSTNDRGERLLSLVDHTMIPAILDRLLNEEEFLSDHGIRSVSRAHARNRELGTLPGVGSALIEYEPGESRSPLFGGNSNWRGPVWMPINYSIIQALTKFYRHLGPNFTLEAQAVSGREVNLQEIANALADRLIDLFRKDEQGRLPIFSADSPFQADPHWKDLRLFHECFHGDTGLGLGASHQTGWSGLVANLIKRKAELVL